MVEQRTKLGREIEARLREFLGVIKSGKPLADHYRITQVEINEDTGEVMRKVIGPGLSTPNGGVTRDG